ncbi:hypothetical protein [Amycolatopsis sp. NPDC051903]|uniref:hypothetical protein n=1 Tax=Amycolatopsis sp. NPDC051903 TaxID=3363936 RepID=UPI0037ADC283
MAVTSVSEVVTAVRHAGAAADDGTAGGVATRPRAGGDGATGEALIAGSTAITTAAIAGSAIRGVHTTSRTTTHPTAGTGRATGEALIAGSTAITTAAIAGSAIGEVHTTTHPATGPGGATGQVHTTGSTAAPAATADSVRAAGTTAGRTAVATFGGTSGVVPIGAVSTRGDAVVNAHIAGSAATPVAARATATAGCGEAFQVLAGGGEPFAQFKVVAEGAQALPRAVDRGEFDGPAAAAEPLLHLGQREQRAGRGAADGPREVAVAAAPVAHRGAAHPREPGDVGGVDRRGVVHGQHDS